MIWKYITIGMQGKGGEGGKTRMTHHCVLEKWCAFII